MRDTAAVGLLAGFESMLPADARPGSSHRGDGGPIELVIDKHTLDIGGRRVSAIAVNGTVPGPLVRLREGQEAVIRVTNRMKDEDASIHWHVADRPDLHCRHHRPTFHLPDEWFHETRLDCIGGVVPPPP